MKYCLSLILVYLFNILTCSIIFGINNTAKSFSPYGYYDADYLVYGNVKKAPGIPQQFEQLIIQPALIYSLVGQVDIYNNYPPYNSGFALDIYGNNYYYNTKNDSYTKPIENGQWTIVKSNDESYSKMFDAVYNVNQELIDLLNIGYVSLSFLIIHFLSILNFCSNMKPKEGMPYKSQISTLIYMFSIIIMTLIAVHKIHNVLKLIMAEFSDSTYGSVWIILVFLVICQIIIYLSIIIILIKCNVKYENSCCYTMWHFPCFYNCMEKWYEQIDCSGGGYSGGSYLRMPTMTVHVIQVYKN
jgi:hypothetical protein